jgi:hypothetical protein
MLVFSLVDALGLFRQMYWQGIPLDQRSHFVFLFHKGARPVSERTEKRYLVFITSVYT